MHGTDPWNGTDGLDAATLDVMVARLEARGNNDAFLRMLDDYLDVMGIDGAKAVLDLGCGSGLVTRRICVRRGFSGTCLGIDLSDYLVEQAQKFAAAEGLGNKARFETGDTASLQLSDGAFDAVILHTLISHVDDPLAVLTETARVVAPGGRIAVFDGDYASLTFEQEDPVQSKANSEKKIAALVTQPRVMRQMPRLAKQAGLKIERCLPSILTEVGKADFWTSSIDGFRKLGPKSGLVTQAEADRWADDQHQASSDGVFFGSCTYYAYILRKT